MQKRRKKYGKFFALLSSLILASLMTFAPMKKVMASAEFPLVMIENYSVSGDKIVPGENFVLTIVLKNYNKNVDAESVVFNVDYPGGVAPVYGTTSQKYIGSIGAGRSVEFGLEFSTLTSINKDTVDFYFGIYGDNTSSSAKVSIPCGTDVPISIVSSSIPHSVVLGDGINTSVTFKVLGTENISNVIVDVLVNGNVVESGHIGIMTAGVTKTQGNSISVYEVGEYVVEMQIRYTDQSGRDSVLSVGSTSVSVVESEEQLPSKPDTNQSSNIEEDGADNMLIMAVSAILIVLIGSVIIYLFTRKRR